MPREIKTSKEFLELLFAKLEKYQCNIVSKQNLYSLLQTEQYDFSLPMIWMSSPYLRQVNIEKALFDLEKQFYIFTKDDTIDLSFSRGEGRYIERQYESMSNKKMEHLALDYIYLSTYGKNGGIPFDVSFENPNQVYLWKEKRSLIAPYQELLTDGHISCSMKEKTSIQKENCMHLLVEDANFVIVREKHLGKYQMGNLITKTKERETLSYYSHLFSISYAKMHKVKPHVYQLTR